MCRWVVDDRPESLKVRASILRRGEPPAKRASESQSCFDRLAGSLRPQIHSTGGGAIDWPLRDRSPNLDPRGGRLFYAQRKVYEPGE